MKKILLAIVALVAMAITWLQLSDSHRGTPKVYDYATRIVDADRVKWRRERKESFDSKGSVALFVDGQRVSEMSPSNVVAKDLAAIIYYEGIRSILKLPIDGNTTLMFLFAICKLPDNQYFISGGMPCSQGKLYQPGDAVDGIGFRTWFFDPSTNKVREGPFLRDSNRVSHTATLLRDGKVLISGGCWPPLNYSSHKALLVDPEKNSISSIGSLKVPRTEHIATDLTDNVILIIGGATSTEYSNAGYSLTSTIEALDKDHKESSVIGQLHFARQNPSIGRLPDGRILIYGGCSDENSDTLPVEQIDESLLKRCLLM